MALVSVVNVRRDSLLVWNDVELQGRWARAISGASAERARSKAYCIYPKVTFLLNLLNLNTLKEPTLP